MKKYLITAINNPIFSGSLVMIFGSNFTNFINYLFHLILGRSLGPTNYGELATLLTILGLISMIPTSLALVVVKFISSAQSKREVEVLIGSLNKKIYLLGLGLFLLTVILSFQLSQFLNIKNPFLLIMVGATLLCSLPALFYRSVLQGLLRFNQLIVSTLGENSIKLILAFVLVLLGFSLPGVMLSISIASLVGLLITLFFTKDLRAQYKKGLNPKFKSMFLYSVPVLIQSLAMTSLYSADLILVKHFFSSFESGLYAALSTLSKIIFFGAGPISTVMFPMIAKKYTGGENYRKIFINSLVLTVFFSGIVTLVYWIFPGFAIRALYGSAYLSAAYLLVWFGLFMTFFTVASLLLSFYLSLGKTKVVILPLIAALAQICLIWFFHTNLSQIIFISLAISILLAASLGFYSLHDYNIKNG